MSSYGGYLLETFVTLLAVCALAVAVLYGARRFGLGRPRGPISLLGQLPLDARRAIYLVRVGNQVLVIGAAEGGLTKLGEAPFSELSSLSSEAAATASFASVLANVRAQTAIGLATPTDVSHAVPQAGDEPPA